MSISDLSCLWWNELPVEGRSVRERFANIYIKGGTREVASFIANRDERALDSLDLLLSLLKELDPSEEELSYWTERLPERYEDAVKPQSLTWLWNATPRCALPPWVTPFEMDAALGYVATHLLPFLHLARVDAHARGLSMKPYYTLLSTHDSYLKCIVVAAKVTFINATRDDHDVGYSSTLDRLYEMMDNSLGPVAVKVVETPHTHKRNLSLASRPFREEGEVLPRGPFLTASVVSLVEYVHYEVYKIRVGDEVIPIKEAVGNAMRMAQWHLRPGEYRIVSNYYQAYPSLIESKIALTTHTRPVTCSCSIL